MNKKLFELEHIYKGEPVTAYIHIEFEKWIEEGRSLLDWSVISEKFYTYSENNPVKVEVDGKLKDIFYSMIEKKLGDL